MTTGNTTGIDSVNSSQVSSVEDATCVTVTTSNNDTSATCSSSPLDKKVIIRGTNLNRVTIPYNAQKEAERRYNLIANRGARPSMATTNK